MRFIERRFAGRCQRVEAPAGTIFTRGDGGIFPAALEEAHVLEAGERSVERAVGGQQPRVAGAAERTSEFVAMEGTVAAGAKLQRGGADGELDGEQSAGFPAHRVTISRYLRIVKWIMVVEGSPKEFEGEACSVRKA